MFDQLTAVPRPGRPKAAVTGTSSRDVKYPAVHTPWKLTPTQCEIARLLCEFKTVHEIGQLMCLSPKTIYTQLDRAYDKMGVGNILQVALMYDRHARSTL